MSKRPGILSIPGSVLEDFRNHMFVCFKAMGLGTPTPAQYAIGEALQYGPPDMQLQAGRGFGKSVIVACLVTWWLCKDPDSTIMVVSASADKAIEFVSMCRTLFDLVPYMAPLKPQDNDRDNLFGFNVGAKTRTTQDSSVSARGITSQLTGKHVEYLVFDDVEVENNSATEPQREKLLRRVLEAEQIRNRGGRIVFLGTPQTEDSIYNKLRDGYPTVKFPAEIPDRLSPIECKDVAEWVINLSGDAGDPTQPERFSRDVLDERLARIGPRLYALNYKLQTALADINKYPLKLKDLLVCDLDRDNLPAQLIWQGQTPLKGVRSFGMTGDWVCEPMHTGTEYMPPERVTAFVDPSGRGDDETTMCVMAVLNGRIYVLALEGWSEGYSDSTLYNIINLAAAYRVTDIICEDNYGDGMFTRLLMGKMNVMMPGVSVIGKKVPQVQKEKRILDTLEPLFASHKIVFDTKAINHEQTQRQITRMCHEKGALAHDDRVDVLAFGAEHLKTHVHVDPLEALAKYHRDAQEKLEKRFEGQFRLQPGDLGSSGCCIVVTPSNPVQMHKQSPWDIYKYPNNSRRL